MKNKKLSPKEKIIKMLETKQKNLVKKLADHTETYKVEHKQIEESLEIVELQLKGLKK